MGLVIGRRQQLLAACLLAGLIAWLPAAAQDGKLWHGDRLVDESPGSPNFVHRRCLTPEGNERRLIETVSGRWSLPRQALAADFDTTLHCLVLRYNFQYEDTDDPNTTGRGVMDLSRPLDTLTDAQYIERVGHLIDPPPHDSVYFDALLRALNRYWETVSGGQIHLSWDIYPPYRDSTYQLPHPMNHYGRCDFSQVVEGLEDYFVDCIRLADTTNPEIDFSQYSAFFLFHAGSDRQSDIGFPETCSDLFSGYIRFAGEVPVDNSTHFIRDALMMPETNVQDNRATALNAVMAHEFGHQLGLVDLYNTENFITQLGDFALMDNNGFGTGIDFGWPVGKVFGAIPLYPCAWSRAFLGIDEVVDFRADTAGVLMIATALTQDPGLKVARIPITETEYYLAEVRLDEVDNHTTYVLADSVTSVIQGPVDSTRAFTGEYDFLMPGSGMLIYHVDEEVAALDHDGDGQNNFDDNDLQWFRDERKFIRLVEAGGIVHFGGYYRAGYGSQEDFFRDDQKQSFTPNTNPATFDNSGNNSHIYLENIGRAESDSTGLRDDRFMYFDLAIDRKVDGFPIRAGIPQLGLAPIADDLDGDGTVEIITAAGRLLSVVTSTGDDFIRTISGCGACPLYYDTAITSVNRGIDVNPAATYPVPLYAQTPGIITAGPVTGRMASSDTVKLVAVGYPHPMLPDIGAVALYEPADGNGDATADLVITLLIKGLPIAFSFGDSVLYALTVTDTSRVYRWRLPSVVSDDFLLTDGALVHGHCRIDDDLVVLASDTLTGQDDSSWVHFISDDVYSFGLKGLYVWGPISVDLDLDGRSEVVAFTPEGDGVYLTIDTTGGSPTFSILAQRSTDHIVMTAPIVGDVDLDGRPDIIVAGRNELLAFNADLLLKTGFPREIDDRFPFADAIAAPVMADIQAGDVPELIFPTSVGNFYSYGSEASYGFPLTTGEQRRLYSNSSAVLFHDSTGGKLGYLGGDGWFYAWEVDVDTLTNFWPMNGGGPAATFAFDGDRLPAISAASTTFDDRRFYNYPNPVRDGSTRIRYYLGAEASSVQLNIYDLSGVEIAKLAGTTSAGIDNEVVWDCSGVTSGVYRCVIRVEYPGNTESSFTDIAVIR